MGLPTGIVAFLDILGYKQMVEKDSGLSGPVFLPIIENILGQLKPMLSKEGLQLKQFSDSVVLSINYSVLNTIRLINAVSDVQWFMTTSGILIRGGIAIGRHYSNGDIVYSQGLIEAYLLESQNARVPRVLVDSNLLELIIGTAVPEVKIEEQLKKLLAIDTDKRSFVNYLLGRDVKQHECIIRKLLQNVDVTKPGLFEKYNWLTQYHNFIMKVHGLPLVDFGLPKISSWSSQGFDF